MAWDTGASAKNTLSVQLAHSVVSRTASFGSCFEGSTEQWPPWEKMAAGAACWAMNGWWGTPCCSLAKTWCLILLSDVVCTLPEILQLLDLKQLFGKEGNWTQSMRICSSVSPFLPFLRHCWAPPVSSGNHWWFRGLQECPAFWLNHLGSERQNLMVCVGVYTPCWYTIPTAADRASPAYIWRFHLWLDGGYCAGGLLIPGIRLHSLDTPA